MIQKDDIELRRAALLKAARSAVRLKHALAADEELNIVLPELDRRYSAFIQTGAVPAVEDILRDAKLLL